MTVAKPSVLPGGVGLCGDVRGACDFVVFGTVEGDIDIGGALIVERGGRVDGNVRAQAVTVRGAVTASVSATTQIRVEASAVVIGDLTAPAIDVVDGGRVLGKLDTSERVISSSDSCDTEVVSEPASRRPSARAGLLLIRKSARSRGMAGNAGIAPPPPRMPELVRVRARSRDGGVDDVADCLPVFEG